MRKLGYLLLVAGFLWVAYDAIIAFPHNHYADTRLTAAALDTRASANGLPPAWRPNNQQFVLRELLGLYNLEQARYRMILLPSCLVLFGALILRPPTEPRIIVEEISKKAADPERTVDESRRELSPAQVKRMRKWAYILLLFGFVWLVRDGVAGIERYQYRTTHDITKGMLALSEEAPKSVAADALWDLYHHMRRRYWILLLPGCFMLAGGLMLGAQNPPAIIVERNLASAGDLKRRLDETKGYRAHPPQKGAAYRRGLLGLARRAIATSPFFRKRDPKEQADEGGP